MKTKSNRSDIELTQSEERFALEYVANQGNGAAAYRASHPGCRSAAAAAVGAVRMLRNAKVQNFIDRERVARRKRLRMDADEALEGITRHARADIRRLFKDGKLIPVDQWPEEIADAVKAVKHTAFGPTIVMYDKLKARELMAVATGALRPKQHSHTFDLAEYLGAEPPLGDDEK